MSIRQEILDGLKGFVAKRTDGYIPEVLSWEEGFEGPDWPQIVVRIKYIDDDYDPCTYTYRGSFTSLIDTLIDRE